MSGQGGKRWWDWTNKEEEMDVREDNQESGDSGRSYPSESHRALGMTHEELLADMARRGETRESSLAAFDRAVARAMAATEPERQVPHLLADAVECEAFSGIRFHDERVAAGPGFPLGESEGSRCALPSDFFGKQDWGSIVAARVSGWSMRDANIADGDTVLVDTRREAKDGDIVLAHVGGHGQMVKRLRFTEWGGVWLASDNPGFAPIMVDDPECLTIHGVVVARSGQV